MCLVLFQLLNSSSLFPRSPVFRVLDRLLLTFLLIKYYIRFLFRYLLMPYHKVTVKPQLSRRKKSLSGRGFSNRGSFFRMITRGGIYMHMFSVTDKEQPPSCRDMEQRQVPVITSLFPLPPLTLTWRHTVLARIVLALWRDMDRWVTQLNLIRHLKLCIYANVHVWPCLRFVGFQFFNGKTVIKWLLSLVV